MMRRVEWLLVIGVVALVACGGGAAPQSSGQAAPGASATTSGGGGGNASAAAEGPTKVNMDEIFPQGAGRDLVLNNCQNCHTFVPIVILQMDEDAWTRSSLDHRPRVTGLSDDEFKTLYTYLKANFNPNRPVPKLPKELLESWTTY